jgi:tetratricopeptide (TPR) repeat protein
MEVIEVQVDLVILEINKMKMDFFIYRHYTIAIALVFSSLIAANNIQGQESDFTIKSVITVEDEEYYFAFTEATKFYLFGNYVQAINLYNECLKIKPQSAAVHYQLAKIYMNAGKIPIARENAKFACTFSGNNKWYLQILADIYQIEEKFDSSIIVLKKLQSKDNEDINYVFSIASLYEKVGKFDEALYYLDMVDKRIGLSKEVSISRYRIYSNKKLYSIALKQLKIANDLSNNDYSVIGMIAEFFRGQHESDSAYQYYLKIYPVHKDDPVVVFSFSEFLLELGKIDSAKMMLIEIFRNQDVDNDIKSGYLFTLMQKEDLFKKSQSILDTIVNIYYKLYYDDIRSISIFSDIEIKLGNFRKASVALKRIVVMDDGNYPAFEQLIFCLNFLGERDSVEFYSEKAINEFRNKPVPYLFNGSAKFQNKDYLKATTILERGLTLTDNRALKLEFYGLLAECYESMDQYDKSVKAFNLALAIDRNNVGIKNNYAYYLSLRKENLPLAKIMSKTTIKAEAKNSTYLDTYAWILYEQKRFHIAKKYLLKALKNGGDKDEDILWHYAEILFSLKEYQDALIYFNKVKMLVDENKRATIQNRINFIDGILKR